MVDTQRRGSTLQMSIRCVRHYTRPATGALLPWCPAGNCRERRI